MIITYTRPSKTKATAVGDRNRARWTRHLRKRLVSLVPTIEIMSAEEGATNAARNMPWDNRPRWITTRIRIDQMAVIEMLQARHLKATGKEISRAEVLAALMAEGLDGIINHVDFSASPTQTFSDINDDKAIQ